MNMHRLDLAISLILIYILLISINPGAEVGNDAIDDLAALNHLILNVYVDDAGKCLVNGYIEDPGSLAFLNSSEYTYEEDNRQLYAITNALTSKSKDSWKASLESAGRSDECRIIFYLPEGAKLNGVNSSAGLTYQVYAANRSVVVEAQGHDIMNPVVDIEYTLQLEDKSLAGTDMESGSAGGSSYLTAAMLILLFSVFCLLIFLRWPGYRSTKQKKSSRPIAPVLDSKAPGPEQLDLSSLLVQQSMADPNQAASALIDSDDDGDGGDGDGDASGKGSDRMQECSVAYLQDERQEEETELDRVIYAVMDTLTDKEQAIIKGLLQHGGSMTQRDISYEMNISKSSLSGILTSMERRKLITKSGKGRTNVIELSERFLNNKERS